MPVREHRGTFTSEMHPTPDSEELETAMASSLPEWAKEAYTVAPPLVAVEEATSPASQLKRQAAIRRDGSTSDLKSRSPKGGIASKHPVYDLQTAWPCETRGTASSPSSSSGLHGINAGGPASAGPSQPSSSRIRNGSISRNGAPRLAFNLASDPENIVHKRLSALSIEDPRTPRPRDRHDESPRSPSSCESEEDKQLLTPLDGAASLALGSAVASPLSQSFSADAVSTPPDTMPAARVGMRLGVGAIGASTDVGQLGLGLDGRRGFPDATPSPLADDDRSKQLVAPPMRAGGSGHRAPSLSRQTLYQMGIVEGLTPPASSVSATGGMPIEVSSVVTTGLEMGLGVSLASSALINHIPGASSAVSGLAEPRYLRPTGGSMDGGSLIGGMDPKKSHLTENQLSKPAEPGLRQGAGPDPDEPSQTMRDNAESDLHRRRTTGWVGAKGRTDPSRLVRHQRADTHDPVISHARAQMLLQHEKQQHHQNNYISHRPSPSINTQELPTSYMLDMPLSAETSLDRNSSFGGRSSSRAHASIGGSTHPGTPSLSEMALMSPDVLLHGDGASPFYHRPSGLRTERDHQDNPKDPRMYDGRAAGTASMPQGPANGALMGLGSGGHFAPGVRAKVAEVLPQLIAGIPLGGEQGETVTIAEYGCLNTRSMQLMQPIISWFAEKAHAADAVRDSDGSATNDDYFGRLGGDNGGNGGNGGGPAGSSMPSVLGVSSQSEMPCRVNFSIVHEDSPQADFRPVSQTLDTSSESYLNPHWQATHEPSLQNAIFQSFVSRPFASRIVPPSTVHLGISLMDLHWSHTPRNPAVSQATSAHAELTAFLTARAHEFRKGGVFLMAYIARSDEGSSGTLPVRPKSTVSYPAAAYSRRSLNAAALVADDAAATAVVDLSEPLSPASIPTDLKRERSRSNSTPSRPADVSPTSATSTRSSDIWTTLTDTLAPCLQRLVSCGMLKSDVARHLLTLPMHPRTPRQTQNVLRSVKHLWKVEWSCGLEETQAPAEDTTPTETTTLRSEAEALRLPHPAWKALQAGTLSRVAFAEHMIQLFKNLYEAHFRVILREKGRLSKGAVEFVLDSLWDVLQSRIDDQEPCPIAECELEVQVVALRRL